MLAIPEKGMARSVTVHNVDLDVLCDWIEAIALFEFEPEVAQGDIVDALCDANVYATQAKAWEIVADAWNELRRRVTWVGAEYPLLVLAASIRPVRPWRNAAGYSFCLALSLAKWFPKWARQFGKDFTVQGDLFERFTRASIEASLAGWTVHSTGWSRTRANRLGVVVTRVAGHLGEQVGKVERWTRPSANEAGLDLVCFRPFPDNRVGIPVYLFQCASGGDWEGKFHTPNLRIWARVVDFTAEPKKAFATPFAFLDSDFVRTCNLVNGLLLDRYRLLCPGRAGDNWLPAGLADEIVAWLEPRVAQLPPDA